MFFSHFVCLCVCPFLRLFEFLLFVFLFGPSLSLSVLLSVFSQFVCTFLNPFISLLVRFSVIFCVCASFFSLFVSFSGLYSIVSFVFLFLVEPFEAFISSLNLSSSVGAHVNEIREIKKNHSLTLTFSFFPSIFSPIIFFPSNLSVWLSFELYCFFLTLVEDRNGLRKLNPVQYMPNYETH